MFEQTEQALARIAQRLMSLVSGAAVKLTVAGPADDVDGNLALLVQRAESLRGKVRGLKDRIDRVLALLDRPKQAADALKNLSSELGTLTTLLRVVSVIRVIRPAADVLRNSVEVLKRPVDAAEGRARTLDRLVEPLRSALRRIQQPIANFLSRLDQLIAQTNQMRDKVRTVRTCMAAMPAGAARDRGLQLLDDFARTVNPSLRSAADALQNADGAVGALDRELSTLEGQLDEIRRTILAGIDSVRGAFGPILGPLRALQSALDYRIDIKIFSFSLRQILDGLSLPWPFSYLEDAFWDAANSILQPILRTLHLDISLPSIPGLDLLDRIRPEVPSLGSFEAAVGNVTGLADNARNLLDRFNVTCPPKSEQRMFSEELLADLAEAEPRLLRAAEEEAS